jgi:DNA-binding SARP family transcriptional activator
MLYFKKAYQVHAFHPLDEELYCQAMRAYALLSDRAGLAGKYQQLKTHLAAELDVEHLPATSALYQALSGKIGI